MGSRVRPVLRRTAWLTLALLSAAAALALPASRSVWIDRPLDGSSYVEGFTVPVTAHATSDTTVEAFRLEVDGASISEKRVGVPAGELAMVELEWVAARSGVHVLAVWAVTGDGEVGPALATVEVVTDPTIVSTTSTSTTTTPTPTSTSVPPATTTTTSKPPSSTTTVLPTTTTTAPPCEFSAPTLVAPGPDARVTNPFVTMSWDYTGCRLPLEFNIEVATNPDFTVVADSANVADTQHTSTLGCGTYWWRVRALTFDDVGPWSSTRSFSVFLRSC